jgi:hypothetical protein
MGMKARRERVAVNGDMPACKGGANYHVFTLGASACSICGWERYPKPKAVMLGRQDILVKLENPHEECGLYEVVVLNAESHDDAEETARNELGGEDWTFISSSTLHRCSGCGGYREVARPHGMGAIGYVRIV